MAAEVSKDKKSSIKPITEDQRFRYIGFEVFPGKVKDLFRTDAEREKYVDGVRKKREKGDTLRDQCTLLEERISATDRIVLTIASVLILATLFIPWYSVYNEKVEVTREAVAEQAAVPTDSTMMAVAGDTLAGIAQPTLSPATPAPGTSVQEGGREKHVTSTTAAEEVISGYVAKKKVHKEYSRVSGLGSLIALGSVGSDIFSSGGALVITAILFLIYTLLCIGIPAYTLFGLYGIKGNSDERALELKRMLRLNWAPLIIFVLAVILSFFGGEYGSDAGTRFTSLGDSYGPGVFLGTLSWGIIVSLGAFILVAVKGIEI